MYNHNLVNALYAMKGLIGTYLVNQDEGRAGRGSHAVLKRAYGQADTALRIAKRLGAVGAFKEEKKTNRKNSSVSIKRVWQNTLASLKRDFSLEGVEVLERIPEPFPWVQCQAADLREILYHLIRNAIQAMPCGGTLVVRAQISFSTKEESFATIQVADTGPGIPASELSHLFSPFYSTKSSREGNGLGLYLTHQLVRRNQGRITASSFQGSGTTFTLEFPLARKK
jgi:signal transduction histidine kinase